MWRMPLWYKKEEGRKNRYAKLVEQCMQRRGLPMPTHIPLAPMADKVHLAIQLCNAMVDLCCVFEHGFQSML